MTQAKYSRYYTYIKPVTSSKLIKSSAPYIFSLVAITIFTIFVIRPTLATIAQLQKNIENSKKTLVAINKKTDDLSLAKQNLDNLGQGTKDKIETALPYQAKVTSLIQSLKDSVEKHASLSAIQIQSVTLYDVSTQKNVGTVLGQIEFSLSSQGSYDQLTAILNDIRNQPRIITLTNTTLVKPAEGAMSLSVTGRAYLLK